MKKDPENIDQKLLVLYLLGEISQSGRAKVEAWLNESEENRASFESLQKTWNAAGEVNPADVAFNAQAAWDRLEPRLSSSPRLSLSYRLLIAAAVLAIGLFSVIFIGKQRDSRSSGEQILAAASVPVQEKLADGSSVVLNANSRLKVPKSYAKTNRKVVLEGEAFFEVAHDSANPFIISAGPGQIRVLGTSFHVRAYPGADVEVFVETGRVELSRFDKLTGDTTRIILKAGERGEIRQADKGIDQPPAINPDELFWANRKLIFQETRLEVVFDLLKRHYEANIEVRDSTIMNCKLSAIFTNEPVDQILEVVAASFDLTVSREKEIFIINGKGCGNETK